MQTKETFDPEKLVHLIEKSKLSSFTLAVEIQKETGYMVVPATLGAHATGRNVPSANHLRAYARYFKVSEKYFFTSQESSNAPEKESRKKEGYGAKASPSRRSRKK